MERRHIMPIMDEVVMSLRDHSKAPNLINVETQAVMRARGQYIEAMAAAFLQQLPEGAHVTDYHIVEQRSADGRTTTWRIAPREPA